MKNHLKNLSIKSKIIIAFSFVILMLCGQGIYFISNLSSVNDEIKAVVHDVQPALLTIKTLSEETKQASSSLSFYLVSKEESQQIAYKESLDRIDVLLNTMHESVIIKELENGDQKVTEITEQIHTFSSHSEKVLKLATNESENIIAIKYTSEKINPIVNEISQLLSQAIDEDVDQSARSKIILADLNNLRYSWSTLTNEMRLFLAFRVESSKNNMTLYIDKVNNVINKISKQADALGFEQAESIEQVSGKFSTFKNNLETLIMMHESEKWRTDAWLIRTDIYPLLETINLSVSELTAQLKQKSKSATVSVEATYINGRNQILIGTSIVFIIVSIVCWFLIKNITRPIAAAVNFANKISEGDLSGDIEDSTTDEIGQLLSALQAMKENMTKNLDSLKENIDHAEEMKNHAEEMKAEMEEEILSGKSSARRNARFKQALHSVNVNVMIVNKENIISFVNDSLNTLFHSKSDVFATDIAGFDANKIADSNISTVINDNDVLNRIDRLDKTYKQERIIDSNTFEIIMNPVFNKKNERVGTVIEWNDRTDEIAIENEINTIVSASLSGDLSQRIDINNKSGFFEQLSHGVNEMVDMSDRIISDTIDVLSAMSHGDLTKTIQGNYHGSFAQLKNDTNNTIAKLTEVMGDINSNANSVLNGAHEIAQGNTNLSQRTEEQASSLEVTASSMEEMTSTVRQNADNTSQANQLAAGAREMAEQGGEVVRNAVDAMSEITKSSKKIADIIGVIDEIAFQTNLLALNAAVEAARAGEQGRGFAVVASEVRNLAGRSATAAKEIKSLINESVVKVGEGSKLVDESGNTIDDIMGSVTKVSDIIAEIAAAGEEQSEGIEQVNKAINQMDQMTQQNASLVEQAAAASEAMGEQAGNLNQLVGFFTTNETSGGQSTNRRSSSRPWNGQDKPAASTNPNTLDFSAARTKHLSWKTRLRSFLDGNESMTKDQAVSHHDCDLGKWLYSAGLEKYGHMAEMNTLEKTHAELHGIIKDVVRMKHDGDHNGAETRFSKVETTSGQIVGLLNHIEAEVKAGKSSSTIAMPLQKTGNSDEWDEF